MRLDQGHKKIMKIVDISLLSIILEQVQDSPHVVVLVSYSGGPGPQALLGYYQLWQSAGQSRKLIVVSSMAGIHKVHLAPKRRQFKVSSWTEEEYMDAIDNDDLFASVESCLDGGVKLEDPVADTAIITRRKLLASKYYFGGGFCRGV